MTRTITFPPEIWSHVLNNLPKSHQLQLLHVSSLFHDIVIKSLFASVKIFFIGGRRGLEMLHTKLPDWMEDIAIKMMRKSWELLNHIVQEPRFANAVKSITVVAFSDGLSLFERCQLLLIPYPFVLIHLPTWMLLVAVAKSLKALPNLHTFRWIGNGPSFDEIVAKSLPANLKALEVQS